MASLYEAITDVWVQQNSKSCPKGYRTVTSDINKNLGGNDQAICVKSELVNMESDVVTDIKNINGNFHCENEKDGPWIKPEDADYIGIRNRCSGRQKLCIKRAKLKDSIQYLSDINIVPHANAVCNRGYSWILDGNKGCPGTSNVNLCAKKTPTDLMRTCDTRLDDPQCREYAYNHIADMNPSVFKYCSTRMSEEFCKNWMKAGSETNTGDLNVKADNIVREFCVTHLDDPYCGCYKQAPDFIPPTVAGLNPCWSKDCGSIGYQPRNMRNITCPDITYCKQDFGAIGGDANILDDIKLTQNCGPDSNKSTSTGSNETNNSTNPNSTKSYWWVYIIIFIVIVCIGIGIFIFLKKSKPNISPNISPNMHPN